MSEQSINRKVAVITHSSRGIGKVIAYEFAKAGYAIVINDIDELELEHTAKDISRVIGDDNNGNRVGYIPGDISEEQIAVSLIDEAIKKFGRSDVLVNNAVLVVGKPMKANEITTYTAANTYHKEISPYFTLEEYEIIDTSLKDAYLCIREAVKQMLLLNKEGSRKDIYSIINISACRNSIPKTEANAYKFSNSGVEPFTASRVGVKALIKTVATQLADNGIRVNAIAPGIIDSGIINNRELLEEKREEKEKEIPFRRIGQAEEIAKIALFLASDSASYVTGSVICADGGLSLPRSNYFLESEIGQD
jgi:NAD(P)-dependent dehydrogenase (short-subunit alcohol dehydrogenase family)